MNSYSLLPLGAFLIHFSATVYAIPQVRRISLRNSYIHLALLLSAFALLDFILWNQRDNTWLNALSGMLYFAWMPLGVFFLRFCYRLTGHEKSRSLQIWYVLLAAGLALGLTTDLIIEGFERTYWGIYQIPGQLHIPLCTALCLAPALQGMARILSQRHQPACESERRQRRLILIGAVLTATTMMLMNVYLPALLGGERIVQLSSTCSIFLSICICSAISRYDFLGITSEELAERLFDRARDGVILTAPGGRVMRCNAAALRYLSGHEKLQAWVQALQKRDAYAPDRELNFEETLGEGTDERILSVHHLPYQQNGAAIGHLLMLHDITELKKTESALLQTRDELEERVRLRTDDLRQANEQLRQEIEERQASQAKQLRLQEELFQSRKLEALGKITGGVAHDFNNQLSVMMGFADLLRKELPEEHQKEFSEKIFKAAKHSSHLTRQLLTFARKGEVKMEPVDLPVLVEDVAEMLSRSIDKRIHILQSHTPEHSTIQGDAAMLENAILNLGLNARDAMPHGGRLTLKTHHCDLNGHSGVCLTVNDTGTGMSKDVLDRVFEPFFSTKSKSQGTGLGCAAVYGTVQEHGGTIRVESTPGSGTTFTLCFPQKKPKGTIRISANPLPSSAPTGFASPDRRPINARVLVVDDELEVRSVTEAILRSVNCTYTGFSNPLEALAHYQDHPNDYDLVLLDMIMPEMSGADLFHKIRALTPQRPILVISGFSTDGTTENILQEPLTEYLPKPFTTEELCRQLYKILPSGEDEPVIIG